LTECGRPRKEHLGLFFFVALAGAAWDLATKWLAFNLVGRPPEPGSYGPLNSVSVIPGVFSFTTSYNRGALWGFGEQIVNIPYSNTVFAVLSLLAAAAILYWALWHRATRCKLLAISLGLILAGALGNCYDRLVHQAVRDFLYFELINWPIFNFADSFLVCGALLLMVQSLFGELPARAVDEQSSGGTVSASSGTEVRTS